MARILKYIAWIIGSLVFLILAAAFVIVAFYEDEVVALAVKELNKHIAVEVQTQEINLSLLRRFPNASLELKNVTAKSSKNFSRADFTRNTDTLLFARSIFLEFNVIDIFKGNYTLKNIRMLDGKLHLYIDRENRNNYEFWKKTTTTADSSKFSLNLKSIVLKHCDIVYVNAASQTGLQLYVNSTKFSGSFKPNQMEFALNSEIIVEELRKEKTVWLENTDIDLDAMISSLGKNFTVKRCNFIVDKQELNLLGNVQFEPMLKVSLSMSGNKLNMGEIISQMPNAFRQKILPYKVSGLINFKASINGTIGQAQQPMLNVTFAISKAGFEKINSPLNLSGIQLSGAFNNGAARGLSAGYLQIDTFRCSAVGCKLAGRLKLTNLKEPGLKLNCWLDADLAKIAEAYIPDSLESVGGIASGHLQFECNLNKMDSLKLPVLLTSNIRGNLKLSDAYIKAKKQWLAFTGINCNVTLGSSVVLHQLQFSAGGNQYEATAILKGLTGFLAGDTTRLNLEADIHCNDLDANSYLSTSNNEGSSGGFALPVWIDAKVKFRAETFRLRKIRASEVKGILFYHAGIANFNNVSLKSLEGWVSGDYKFSRMNDGSMTLDCKSNMRHLNINALFATFDDFGQSFISQKHLRGFLSGTIDLTAHWDNTGKFDASKLVAQSKVEIENGELIEFTPIYTLKKYVKEEDLKHIRFSNLKNEIYIRDSKVVIPQMDIFSTAFDLTASGIHQFDGKYTYRYTVSLTEIFSKKWRKTKKVDEDFSEVEDDGLGRIRVHLKTEYDGSEVKTTADTKKAREEFSTIVSNERKQLKSIFKEEFNWFKNDTTVKVEPKQQKKTKFKVKFDDENTNSKKDSTNKKKKEEPEFKIEWEDQ